VKALNEFATQGLHPRITFHLDLGPAIGLARVREQTRFEAEGVAFQAKVRAGFKKSQKDDPNRWVKLDAQRKNADELADAAFEALKKRLTRRSGIRPPALGKRKASR
jgi:dTMP kinase